MKLLLILAVVLFFHETFAFLLTLLAVTVLWIAETIGSIPQLF